MKNCLGKGLLVIMSGFLMFSCEKGLTKDIEEGKDSNLSLIPSIEMQNVLFDLKYDVPENLKVNFEVFAENPLEYKEGTLVKKNISPVLTGITNGKGEYKLSRSLSEQVKTIYVYSENLGVPALLIGEISGGEVKPREADLQSIFGVEEVETKTFGESSALTLGTWNILGKPDYLIQRENYKASFINSIAKAIRKRDDYKDEYFQSSSIYVKDKANVYVSIIDAKGLFNNVLGYFAYTGNIKNIEEDDITEVVAFPNTSIVGLLGAGLKRGDKVQLKYYNKNTEQFESEFPAGTSIGWVIHTNGFSLLTWSVNNGIFKFYSNTAWNPEQYLNKHTVVFQKDNQVIVGFEDLPNERISLYKGDADYNDVVFGVTSNPAEAITYGITEIPEVPGDVENDEVMDAIVPLSSLINLPEGEFYDDLMVATRSTLNRISSDDTDLDSYGSIVGVQDELIIASSASMSKMLVNSTGVNYRVVLKPILRLTDGDDNLGTRAYDNDHVVLKPILRRFEFDVESLGNSLRSTDVNLQEKMIVALDQYIEDLKADKPVRIKVILEFEPLSTEKFQELIPAGPYSFRLVE